MQGLCSGFRFCNNIWIISILVFLMKMGWVGCGVGFYQDLCGFNLYYIGVFLLHFKLYVPTLNKD